jgi:hypothetical protein
MSSFNKNKRKDMKKTTLILSMLCMALTASAQTKSRIVEDGGTGPLKVVMTEA